MSAADGIIYGFADGMKSVADAGTQHCWAVRFDALEAHGISVPTSMEEILDVARQLKELYPDSYPVTIGEKDLSRWFQLYSSGLSMVYDGEKFVYAPREYAEDNYAVLEYLHTLSSRTQFIVITHRRGTMEAADVLYGGTMQEQGVSKILRLSLDELAKQLGVTN